MLDGGRAGESAHGFDADDSAVTAKVDPVAPVLFVMRGFESLFAEGLHDLGDAGGGFCVWESEGVVHFFECGMVNVECRIF